MRGFFFAAVARVYLAQTERLEFAVEIPVSTNELCHVVVGSYPAVLKPVLYAVEVGEGRSALPRGLPAFLPLLDCLFDDCLFAAGIVLSFFPSIYPSSGLDSEVNRNGASDDVECLC